MTSLTIVAVIEDDELLPAELGDEREHDVVEAHGRAGGEGVALPVGGGVELAGGARRAVRLPLHVQVRDVHGVRQRLERTRRRTARGGHQSQDSLGHQLTGCTEREIYKEGERERERDCKSAPPYPPGEYDAVAGLH